VGVIFDGFSHQLPDIDPGETAEWLDSFRSVVETRGKARAQFLLMKLLEAAREAQVNFPATVSTPYINSSRGSPATSRWSAASAPTSAGTRPSW
jgi:pyruvate dehydrogenase E1 component